MSDEGAAKYSAELIAAAEEIRAPALFDDDREALYAVRHRAGITTVAFLTVNLGDDELSAILRYRLAQYLDVGFVDPAHAWGERLQQEPRTHVAADDVHLICGTPASGEILCYATLKALDHPPPGATLRTRERPFFPVEQVHGWGVYNRVAELPDLAVTGIREGGRFVRNRRLDALDPRSVRAPMEVSLAMSRLLTGALRDDVHAIVGDFEERVVMQNFLFLHIPMVVLRGTVPHEPHEAYLRQRYHERAVFPFAFATADLIDTLGRLDAIDAALDDPERVVVRLARLRRETADRRSSFEPADGLPTLNRVDVLDQLAVPIDARLPLLETGARVRASEVFADLSIAEAAALGTFMERRSFGAGETVVRAGEEGDALYVVEEGEAVVTAVDGRVLATLGAGEAFGEIAVVTDAPHSATVTAATELTVLRLRGDDFRELSADLPDVRVRVSAATARRLRDAHAGADAVIEALTSGDAAVLGAHSVRRSADPGEHLIRRGDPAETFSFVVAGALEVRDEAGAAITALGPGDFFGEVGLLDSKPRTADVVATAPSVVLEIDRTGFERFMRYSEAAAVVADAATRRRTTPL